MTLHKILTSLALTVLMMTAATVVHAGSYESGVAAYKQKSYANALKYFTAATKENPKNSEAIFYMGLTQVKTGNLQGARQSFEMVTHMLPSDHPTAAKARNNISFITQNQVANASSNTKAMQIVQKAHSKYSKPNYLTHVLSGGKVVHFDLAKMPLKVYIENGSKVPGWTPDYNNVVISSMQTWQNASRGRIRFTKVTSPTNADIIVRWQKNFAHDKLGVSPWQSRGDIIVQSDVHLALYMPDSSVPLTMDMLKNVAIHEFGHALGMKSHSPYPDDVMYFTAKPLPQTSLSERDMNTIQMLYSLEADVKNAGTMSTAQSKQYYDLLSKGVKAQDSGQITQAAQYFQSAIAINNLQYEAKYALGTLHLTQGIKSYNQDKNMPMARRSFQDAVTLLQDAANDAGATEDVKQNLQVAQHNLSLTNK